jgi:hypothetical protein
MLTAIPFPKPKTYEGDTGTRGQKAEAYRSINRELASKALGSNNKPPGRDQIQAPIMKGIHKWDSERITGLTRAVIQLEHHQHEWKIAKGIMTPKLIRM